MSEMNIMNYIKIVIDETVRASPMDGHCRGAHISESFADMDDTLEYLRNRYGRVPGGRNKIYQTIDGNDVVVGFTHSYWEGGYGNERSLYHTDWISLTHVTEEIIEYKMG